MRDYLTLGEVPSDEDCAQVGSADYYERARKEMRALINQLRRQFGEEPPGAQLKMKSFPHDFGTYHEVVCYYDTEDEDSLQYAFRLEAEFPQEWDEEARKELGLD